MKRYKIRLSDEVEENLYAIHDYIALSSLNVGLACSFVTGLERYIKENLSFFPERFPVYKGNIRKAVYPKNTNYLIFFKTDGDASEVLVLKVVNAKQYREYSRFRM